MTATFNPIETAPLDGRNIILIEEWNDVPFIGYWSEKHHRWCADTSNVTVHGDAYIEADISQNDVCGWFPIPEKHS